MTIKEIVENKDTLIAQKKAELKKADGCAFIGISNYSASKEIDGKVDELQVKAVINTTNILDSHGDVHIKGLWKKSLKENKMIMHLQEHNMNFKSIISDGDDLEAKAVDTTFKDLGYDFNGNTQALIFESKVKADRNPYMFEQYRKGNVKNHSVGMRYVKLYLAVNSEDYPEEKAIWDKYYPDIANKEAADDKGYFWAVTEAKVIEGSAVPLGSNSITPTLEVSEAAKNSTSKHIEPPKGTRQEKKIFINLF